MPFVDAVISGLDRARERFAVEERRCTPVGRQLCLHGRQPRRIGREREREIFIGLRRIRHQIRHADGMQQAAGNTGRKAAPRFGDDGQARPQRFVRKCARAAMPPFKMAVFQSVLVAVDGLGPLSHARAYQISNPNKSRRQ